MTRPPRRLRLVRLWLIVSGLWTIATLLRVERLWLTREHWHDAIGGPWLWIELCLPPALFAVVLLAVTRLGPGGDADR